MKQNLRYDLQYAIVGNAGSIPPGTNASVAQDSEAKKAQSHDD